MLPVDSTAAIWQRRLTMSGTENQFSLSRAASKDRRGAKSKFLSSAYETPGKHTLCVKVVDVFGCDHAELMNAIRSPGLGATVF
jgi:hypothetical protein